MDSFVDMTQEKQKHSRKDAKTQKFAKKNFAGSLRLRVFACAFLARKEDACEIF